MGWPDDAVGNGGGLAASFVGVKTVVADGLLAFWREMKKGGGDEVGGLEDLEVSLGGVVAFRAVDDGFGGDVPSDFLEGERMAQQILIRFAHPSRGHPPGALTPLRSGSAKRLRPAASWAGTACSPPWWMLKPECFQERRLASFLGLMSLASRRACRKRWRKSSMVGPRSSAGMQ